MAIRAIQQRVAAEYGVTVADLKCDRRAPSYCEPRHVAMFVATTCTRKTLQQIGRCFDRHHTSVIHSMHLIAARMERDDAFARRVRALQSEFSEVDQDSELFGLLERAKKKNRPLLLATLRSLVEGSHV